MIMNIWISFIQQKYFVLWIVLVWFVVSTRSYSYTWTLTSAPSASWQSITSDSTGQYLAAAAVSSNSEGGIYTSSDYGSTWTRTSASILINWESITSDSTGQYLATSVNGGGIYTSSDYGVIWTRTSAPTLVYWGPITSDSTGRYLAAVLSGGGIYTSSDYGSTWTLTSASTLINWKSITSDSSGQYLAAVVYGGGIYTSSDYGFIWTRTSTSIAEWQSIASDSTGQYLAAVIGNGGGIYTSSDYGVTWIQTSAPSASWLSIASDSSGQYLATVVYVGGIYTSSDYGVTWTRTSASIAEWQSITSDSTGRHLAAVVYTGGIYTSVIPTMSPSLVPTIAPSLVPTVTPSIVPTMVPTVIPSVFPSIVPTVAPILVPTMAPSLAPTFAPTTPTVFLEFDVVITLTNVSSLILSNDDQVAVLQTSALYMQVSSNYLSYKDTIVPSEWSYYFHVLNPSFSSTSSISLGALIGAYIPLSSTSYSNANDLYNSIETNLNAAVSSQEYTITLRSYESPNLAYANVSTLPAYSSPIIIYPSSTTIDEDKNNTVVITMLTLIPPTILIVISIFALALMRKNQYSLNMNAFQSMIGETMDIGLHCITWYYFMTTVFAVPMNDYGVITLLTSKLPTLIAWVIIITMLLFPNLFSNSNQSLTLRDYLYYPALLHRSFMNIPDSTLYSVILIASVLDLKMIRYQPWKKTEFTDISQGYPTINCIRWCCYSGIIGSIIQITGSITILFTNESSDKRLQNLLLVAFSTIDTIYRISKVSMLMIGLDELRKVEKDVLINLKHAQDRKERIDELDIVEHTVAITIEETDVIQTNLIHPDSSLGQQEEEEEEEDEVDKVAIESFGKVLLFSTVQKLSRTIAEEIIAELSPKYPSEDNQNISKVFRSSHLHADETLEMLKQQVKELGGVPVQYMTLNEIRRELNMLFQQCNNGKPYNEERLDYLLRCMSLNPEYKKEKEEETKRWREGSKEFIERSLVTMRGFIPPFIFNISEHSLVEKYGMKKALAKRIITKKCLWLVRIHPQDIEKLHEAELLGRFNPEAQNLDVVELAAVYAALPTTFHKDHSEKKMKWKLSIEEKLKEMFVANQAKKLPKQKVRNDCYNGQSRLFSERNSFHVLDSTSTNSIVDRTSSMRISLEQIGRLSQFAYRNTTTNVLHRNSHQRDNNASNTTTGASNSNRTGNSNSNSNSNSGTSVELVDRRSTVSMLARPSDDRFASLEDLRLSNVQFVQEKVEEV
jgi:hypothetical protein